MAIELSKLPFPLDALEPYISNKTLEFHYGRHHQNYVKALNELIQGTVLDEYSLAEIMNATHRKKQKIYNVAAQVWNHDFMWKCLTAEIHTPTKNMEALIVKDFGSVENLKNEFLTGAKDLFGSGWSWLVKDQSGKLQIRHLPNAENPLQYGEVPLIACDVWEHAYYLDYENERAKYLKNFWLIINWRFVESNLEAPAEHVSSKKKLEIKSVSQLGSKSDHQNTL